jgi:EAL domain-containing protein (putative c-di-GMP-specific phosphodiesterase class I)
MKVSDQPQTGGLSLPLCINVEDRQRAVEHVLKTLNELHAKRATITEEITTTDPDETDTLEKLQRELASIDARITPLDDSMKARLSHVYRPVTDSA